MSKLRDIIVSLDIKCTVVPILKANNIKKAVQVTPINTLAPNEKVLGLVVGNQILENVIKKEIIVEYKSGFRKKHSIAIIFF